MDIPFVDLSRQSQRIWTDAIARVVERGWYIDGPELRRFEQAFAQACGAAECIGVGNGTDALELSLRAAGVAAGDEVATAANAGMYATTAIRAIGATPLYVEIDESLTMSPDALEELIAPQTRAVVVTHLYGRMAAVERIAAITRRTGIALIEDAAQAHGASRNGRPAGSWGLVGAFSFYPTKNLGAIGDGGAVVTSQPAVAEAVRALRQYGWRARFHSVVAGGRNSRLDELQAAVLAAKLPHLAGWNERRRWIARRYSELLGDCRHVQVPRGFELDNAAHLYVIRCAFRDRLREELARAGIGAAAHYPLADYQQPSQRGLPMRAGKTANTDRAVSEVLSLPCYPELRDEELARVAEVVRQVGAM